MKPIHLGVNLDHVATLRQVRGTPYPSPLQAAHEAEAGGADGITVHLREDRRHIQEQDVWDLKTQIKTSLNLEMAVTPDMLQFAEKLKPAHCCLVPEKRQELTTEGGLNVLAHQTALKIACARLHAADIVVSLFIDPDKKQIQAAQDCGAHCIEIHTGHYANAQTPGEQTQALHNIQQAAQVAVQLGLQVHAGHGLHIENVAPIAAISEFSLLNIGHAIVARALFCGLRMAVSEIKQQMINVRL